MYSVANLNTASLMVQNLSFISLEKRFDTATQISIKYRTRPIDIPVNYRGFCSEIEGIKSTCPYNFFLSTLFLIGQVDRIRRNVRFDVSYSSFIDNLIKLYTTSSDNESELLFLTVYNSDNRLRERLGHLHSLRKKLDSDIITLELLEAFAVCFFQAVTVRREEQRAKISWIEPQLNEKYNLRIPLDDILKFALRDLDFFESLLLSRAELYRLVDNFFRSVSNDIGILRTSSISTKKVLSPKNTAGFDSIENINLIDLFQTVSLHQSFLALLAKKKLCNPFTHIWIDQAKGNMAYLTAIIKDLHGKGYYKNKKKPTITQIQTIALKTFGQEIGIDTIKRAKPEDFDLQFIPLATTLTTQNTQNTLV